jgi:hypothetical protein
MRRILFLLPVIVLLLGSGIGWWRVGRADDVEQVNGGWDLISPSPNAVAVRASTKLPGIYPAGSRVKDAEALGGFGGCDNFPKNLGDKTWGEKGAVSLIAFPDEPVAYFKSRGIALRLVNRTPETVAFTACDSQIYIVQEALDAKGAWRAIESLPFTDCGNSFHRVFLGPDQYWEFKARTYDGPIKTKIRFRLNRDGEENKADSVYTGEFEGQVNEAQFRQTQP